MDSRAVVISNLSQIVPGLLAFLGALGWFGLRTARQPEPPPSRCWGALAGLAALAVPSVMAQVSLYLGLNSAGSVNRLPVLLLTLPGAAFWLLLSLGVLLVCALQREDPFRRSLAAAVLAGVLVREGLLLVFGVLGALLLSMLI